MKLTHLVRSVSRRLNAAASAQRNQCLKDLSSPMLPDPHADEYFTRIDGRPVTFRQFNTMMQEHFAQQNAVETPEPNLSLARATE
ncbi:hypothetical protein ACFOHK_15880 [Falsigemmobacter intermedius]|uniref:Uncharacterized protein n=1 Tax=Falsigemmobacter intermedius TaxID=1553448 RepID=A0A3S4XMF1_9RHOB|nr:hypothetical protein [Falsigemmobacter intermedius]RWY39099.1 hypothetical protein EP867_14910 [Falsigemmobacter intermedius]